MNNFNNLHINFPTILSQKCDEYNLKQFIHLSALGINEAIDSDYAKSKLEGESNILKNFPLAIILRPSIVYSVDDNFTTNFMRLLSVLPIFPLYYEGKTKFSIFTSSNPIKEFIRGITSYSPGPLYFGIFVGFISIVASLILICYALWSKFSGAAIPGSSGVIIAISFFSGIILTTIGIMGIYIARIYQQSQNRPRYIIKDIIKPKE